MEKETDLAIQDLYQPVYQHCFGCGASHPTGWHIKSYCQGDEVVARFTPQPQYTGGVPEYLYGGLIAAVLDCHGTASAAAFYHHSEGKTLGVEPLMRCVTASLTVNYLKPTPMSSPLELRAKLKSISGRKVELELSVCIGDECYCRGSMLAIRVKE